MSLRFCALMVVSVLTGCSGRVDVVRTVTPVEARDSGLRPTAIVRGSERIAIPDDARLEATRVVLAHREKLGPDDVIEQDALGRIVGVRRGDGTEVRFAPGTAIIVEGGDAVRGELEDVTGVIPLQRRDRIEVQGSFEADEQVPGGGMVERRRSTGMLIGGATVMLLSYAPSAYIGAISRRPSDRVLLVPVAGPFIDLSQRASCQPPQGSELLPVDPCLEEKASRGALIASGAIQSLGALLFVIGLPTRPHVVETAKPTFKVVPTRNGAAAMGTF